VDADTQLLALGFPKAEVFADAIRRGEAQRVNTTANDVPMYGGVTAWGRTTRALRDATSDFRNVNGPLYGMIRERDNAMIVVVAAEYGAGLVECKYPRSKQDRRTAWLDAIGRYDEANLFAAARVQGPQHNLWVLLVHSTWYVGCGDGKVYAELSRPLGIDEQNHLSIYSHRILFGEIDLGGTARVDTPVPNAPLAPADPQVSRKSGGAS
jgi:hypothetical protein